MTLIPAKVLKPFENYKEGDYVLLDSVESARELWKKGFIDLTPFWEGVQRLIAEVDMALFKEKEERVLQELKREFYKEIEDYILLAEEIVKNSILSPKILNVKLITLANLKRKYKQLKAVRYQKLFQAAYFRPNSAEILKRLTNEELEIYELFSRLTEEYLEV
ncbi:hypothetical protein VFC49_06930 [Thermococcus sp. SY098]|uniref:hypothetical protein n=1 Tax=Thermococcus sp. SY098 TaxID=3111325 RepID=UPI002D7768A3|nr:hypothetical protein [Thermococcus sp. SY098]WRS51819.1 hypothetical protein VFC49_06930 [Thermococcus sp. SY098]